MQGSPGGIDPRAGAEGAVSTLSSNGIPAATLDAYRRAETLLAKSDTTASSRGTSSQPSAASSPTTAAPTATR